MHNKRMQSDKVAATREVEQGHECLSWVVSCLPPRTRERPLFRFSRAAAPTRLGAPGRQIADL